MLHPNARFWNTFEDQRFQKHYVKKILIYIKYMWLTTELIRLRYYKLENRVKFPAYLHFYVPWTKNNNKLFFRGILNFLIKSRNSWLALVFFLLS